MSSAPPTATPIVWRAGETFDSARITLEYVLRGFGDFLIWAGVICVPLGIIGLIIIAPLVWLWRRTRRARKPAVGPVVSPPASPPPEDKPGA